MNRPLAVGLVAAQAGLIAGYHFLRYLHHLSSPDPEPEVRYQVELPDSATNGGGEYRLRFLQ